MGIWSVPFWQCFSQACGFRCFTCNAYIVKVDGMVELVFQSDHHNRIVWDFLFNRNINAQEKSDKKKAYKNDRNNLVFFLHYDKTQMPSKHRVDTGMAQIEDSCAL